MHDNHRPIDLRTRFELSVHTAGILPVPGLVMTRCFQEHTVRHSIDCEAYDHGKYATAGRVPVWWLGHILGKMVETIRERVAGEDRGPNIKEQESSSCWAK